MRVLNVGGGNKQIPIPAHYQGWEHVLLDVNPAAKPDIVCDARELATLPANHYDAVYCSHNLEHYWRHDLPRVLAGFAHVLHPGGFVEARVPDMRAVFAEMVNRGMDIDDKLYESASGPITVNDVVYGFGRQIAQSGNDFYAHKNGFTQESLTRALGAAGFGWVFTRLGAPGAFELHAIGFRSEPTAAHKAMFGLPA